MIVVDTSALIAIMRKEAERDAYVHLIRSDGMPLISVVSVLETTMVTSRALKRGAKEIVTELLLRPISVSLEQVNIAQAAFFDYGKGQGGRAQLNFGDCLVYGLAKWVDAPLLYKGEDFAGTDVKSAA